MTPAPYNGNPGSEVITEAITKLTHKMQITDPARLATPKAPLLKLAPMATPIQHHSTKKHGSRRTPLKAQQPAQAPVKQPVQNSQSNQSNQPSQATQPTMTTKAVQNAGQTSNVLTINQTTAPTPTTGYSTSSNSSDNNSNKYYRNVEPRQFTGKQYDDVEMFLRNIDRFMERAKITNNDEKVDYLHKHLTTDVRITLNKTLTWEETCDYNTQVEFLKKWWPRPKDLEPLRDEFHRMRMGNGETVEEYARRIQMQRRAGWPDESKISRCGMLSDFEKGVTEGLIRGLPKGLRTTVETSAFMETFEIGHHTIEDLLKYIKLQMRAMEKRARSFCKNCGKNASHSTEECTRNKKVSAVQQVAEDDAASTNSSISEDVEPKPFDIYCCEDYAVNALQAPEAKPRAPQPVQQQQPFRQPFRKPFPGNPNFRNPNPQGNFRPRFPGPQQRRPMTPEMKKFVVCYNCGEEGHYSKDCTSEKVKQPEGPVTIQEMREMIKNFDSNKRILWRGIKDKTATVEEIQQIKQDCMYIDEQILAIETYWRRQAKQPKQRRL